MQNQIFEIPEINWSQVNVLLDALIKIENAGEFCKAIVHMGFTNNYVHGCHLYRLDSSAKLQNVAGYGLEYDHLGNSFSIWDENPVAKSVRDKQFEFSAASESTRPILVVPLVKEGSPVGAVTLILDGSVVKNPIDEDVLPVLQKLSTYWLGTLIGTQSQSNKTRPASGSDGQNLTSRQLKILDYMAQGLVNAEIALQLLVSESTVRQETVRIYRELGVGNRSEASSKARALGLIKKQSVA